MSFNDHITGDPREGSFRVSWIQRYGMILKALGSFCFFLSFSVWSASYRAANSSQHLSQSQASSNTSRRESRYLFSEEQSTFLPRYAQHRFTESHMECRAHPWTGTCVQGVKLSQLAQALAPRHLPQPEEGISTPQIQGPHRRYGYLRCRVTKNWPGKEEMDVVSQFM